MAKKQKKFIQKVLAVLLCAVMTVGILPFSAFPVENPLALPASVSLIDEDGLLFSPGQEVTPGEGFYVNYDYRTVESIDSSVKYLLPTLSNHIEVILPPEKVKSLQCRSRLPMKGFSVRWR